MKSKILASVLLAMGAVMSVPASAGAVYDFSFYKLNGAGAPSPTVDEDLLMQVYEESGQAVFKFWNNVSSGEDSSITDIYFDQNPDLFTNILVGTDSGAGVEFQNATPGNLQGGNKIGFSADFQGEADNPGTKWGVSEASEWVSFYGTYATGATLDQLIASLENPGFIVGLKVVGSDGGGAGSYVTGVRVNAVPLPGAVWLFGSALVGFMALSNRRRV
jgi:hypothetical protein